MLKEGIKIANKVDILTKRQDIKMKDSKDLEVDLGEYKDTMMMKVLMKRETTILNLIQDHLQDIMNMKNISQEEII